MRAAVEEKQRLESAVENVREIATSREDRKKGDGKNARAPIRMQAVRRCRMGERDRHSKLSLERTWRADGSSAW